MARCAMQCNVVLPPAQAANLCRCVQVALALHIARFPEAVEDTLADLLPNRITEFLYGLSEAFNSFYTECQARPCSILAKRCMKIPMCSWLVAKFGQCYRNCDA